MKKQKNILVQFFSSIQLSLFTFFVLAIASIVGTIIEQNKDAAYYVDRFGPQIAKLFEILDISNMYNSWWFLSLLVLLSINLIVCTFDRLPKVWHMVVMDNLDTPVERLEKMGERQTFLVANAPDEAADIAGGILGRFGASKRRATEGGGMLLFSQKGAWTRLGVYVVHFSVLVIFVGAIIGSIYGHKGGVTIPEGASASQIYEFNTDRPIPLGFQVRCDRFELSYYDNGMPKEYRSDLTVLKDGKAVAKKSIVVNDPLQYGGFTFYQANYEALNELMVHVESEKSGAKETFLVAPREQAKWPEEKISFGIINIEGGGRGADYRYKVWFEDSAGEPFTFWLPSSQVGKIERPSGTYTISLKRRFVTGLQVAKDPGVWWVYVGCGAMLLGLLVAFFLSHRRVWVYISREGEATRVLLCGSANKNRLGFEKDFAALVDQFQQNDRLTPMKETL